MKNREGFVTNSSSTSYIVKVKSGNENIKPDISNDEELRKYIVKEYGYSDCSFDDFINEEPYFKDFYNKCKLALDEGFSIIFGRISYNGEAFEDVEKLMDKLGVQIEWGDC